MQGGRSGGGVAGEAQAGDGEGGANGGTDQADGHGRYPVMGLTGLKHDGAKHAGLSRRLNRPIQLNGFDPVSSPFRLPTAACNQASAR
jgi:hypothetical protein